MSKAGGIGRRSWVRLAGTLVVAGAGAALFGQTSGAQPAPSAQTPAIVGTWEISAVGTRTTRVVHTYMSDGTMVSISDDHPSRTAQLGVWTQVGDRQFLVRNVSLGFDPSGAVNRRFDVRSLYTVDPSGNTMTARGERYEQDAAGASLGPAATFQTTATRIVPVPLAGSPR